jgi:hypothetical protein
MRKIGVSGRAEGADVVCYKPFDVPNLLNTLQRLTDREE